MGKPKPRELIIEHKGLFLSRQGFVKREIQALLDAKTELDPERLIIITEDEMGIENISNTDIEIIPLWKWLLEA